MSEIDEKHPNWTAEQKQMYKKLMDDIEDIKDQPEFLGGCIEPIVSKKRISHFFSRIFK